MLSEKPELLNTLDKKRKYKQNPDHSGFCICLKLAKKTLVDNKFGSIDTISQLC